MQRLLWRMMLGLVLLLPSLAAAQGTRSAVDRLELKPQVFSALSQPPLNTAADGTALFCSDCGQGSSPCISGGTGANAIRTGGTWSCIATHDAKEKVASHYASLNAAITAAAGVGGRVLIDADTTLTTTATATVPLQFINNAQISIAASQILTVTSSPAQWPLRQLFTGAGATPGVSFSGNIGLTSVSPTWWGANGMDIADDSNPSNYAAVALQSGSIRGSTVEFPRGKFVLANVLVGPGMTIAGAGVGSTTYEGTTFIQLASSNADVFKSNTAYCPGSSYMHSTQFRDFRILGDTATNTLGNGIHITCATGELNTIENVNVSGMPENGILFNGNGTNVRGSHLALHGNGGSGLRIDSSSAASGLNLVHFDDISGDNNTTSLIYYKPPGTAETLGRFEDIKAETSTTGKQPDIIVIDNANGTPVHVENVSAFVGTGRTLNSFVRNTSSSTCRIFGKGFRGGGSGTITSLVQDQNAGTTLPYLTNENVFHFTWAGGILYVLDKGFLTARNLFTGGTVTVTSSTYTLTSADENRLTVFNRAGPIAVTVPSTATSGFANGAIFPFYNRGAGTVTFTPNSGTINGAATLVLTTGQGAQMVSDGAIYNAWVGAPSMATTANTPNTLVQRDSNGGIRPKLVGDTALTLPVCDAAAENTETVFIEGANTQDCGQTGGGATSVECSCHQGVWSPSAASGASSLQSAYDVSPTVTLGPNGLTVDGASSITRGFRVCGDVPGGQCGIWSVDGSGRFQFTTKYPADQFIKLWPGLSAGFYKSDETPLFQINNDTGQISGSAEFLHKCFQNLNTDATDDNLPLDSFTQSVTIKKAWCFYPGSAPATPAVFALKDGSNNALTLAGALVCAAPGAIATPQAVTAGGTLSAFELLRYDVTNTPSPANEHYLLCVNYVLN